MIWLTWRQQRIQLLVATSIALLCVIAFLQAGRGIWDAFTASGLASCFAAGGTCAEASASFLQPYHGLEKLIPLFLALPAILGMLWGAPLVARELEQGTHKLGWTQSVSRTRWLLTKAGVALGATVVLVGVLTAAVTWWSGAIVRATDERFLPGDFDLRGLVPVGYALFAVALGIAVGTLVRKAMTAIGLTLVGFVIARLAILRFARPHFMAPVATSYPFGPVDPHRGMQDWPVSVTTVDRLGNVLGRGVSLDVNALHRSCPDLSLPAQQLPDFAAVQACVQRVGVQVHTLYQPGDRFWAFQWIEFGIFLVLAAALVGLSLIVLRRRSA